MKFGCWSRLSGSNLMPAFAPMLFFSIGVSMILLALAYGSRSALAARRERLATWMPWGKQVMCEAQGTAAPARQTSRAKLMIVKGVGHA